MEEKEIIRSRLNARQKLAALNNEELLKLADNPEEFDYFMDGLAREMNSSFVCYAYRYNDAVRSMIQRNMSRIEASEKLTNETYKVLAYLDEFGSRSYSFRSDFSGQYESIVRDEIGLYKLDLSLEDFDKNALGVWDKINNSELDGFKNDKYYLATFGYLVYFYPDYMRKSPNLPLIQDKLQNIDETSFSDKKEYRNYKRVATKAMNKLDRYTKKQEKEKQRTKSYWGY